MSGLNVLHYNKKNLGRFSGYFCHENNVTKILTLLKQALFMQYKIFLFCFWGEMWPGLFFSHRFTQTNTHTNIRTFSLSLAIPHSKRDPDSGHSLSSWFIPAVLQLATWWRWIHATNKLKPSSVEGRLVAISLLTAETRTFIGRGHLHFLCTQIPHGSNTETQKTHL